MVRFKIVFLFSLLAAYLSMGGTDVRLSGLSRCQIHRGGGNSLPDNSLEAFLAAWGHGVAPEADARYTKDRVSIAFHDNDLRRIPRGIPENWKLRKIAEMNWAELRELDVGSYLGKKYASVRIATMDSIFACMKDRPGRFLYLDEKGAPPELMAKMAEGYGVQPQVYYCSCQYHLLPRWKKMAPQGKTMLWMGSWSKNNSAEEIIRTEKYLTAQLEMLEKNQYSGIDQIQIHVRTDFSKKDPFCPSSTFLRKAGDLFHSKGIRFQVLSWTHGDQIETYRKLWELGVDSFATDYPETLYRFIEEVKMKK